MRGWITCLEGNVEIVALPAGHHEEPAHAGNSGGRGASAHSERGPKQRPSQRLGKSQQAAVTALAAVSSYLDADEELPVFFARLSETVAGLVGARPAGLWRLAPRAALTLQTRALGCPAHSRNHELRTHRT